MENKTKVIKNLYKKIAELQWMAIEIEKSGKNLHQKYNYKSFTDIKKAIMAKMAELKLAVLPFGEMKNFNISKNGNMSSISYIRTIRVVNGENPDEFLEFETPFIGENNDASKAAGSAKTYGLKYLFNELALLPDESLDPDTTEVSKLVEQAKATPPIPKVEKKEALIREISKYMGDKTIRNDLKTLLGLEPDSDIKRSSFENISEKILELFLNKIKGEK